MSPSLVAPSRVALPAIERYPLFGLPCSTETTVTTRDQERWMELIEMLNSEEFDYPSTWFEDAGGNRSTLMANRTVASQYVPKDAKRIRIEGNIWVRGDDWIHHDLQNIYGRLVNRPEYVVQIVDNTLYIELSPGNAA